MVQFVVAPVCAKNWGGFTMNPTGGCLAPVTSLHLPEFKEPFDLQPTHIAMDVYETKIYWFMEIRSYSDCLSFQNDINFHIYYFYRILIAAFHIFMDMSTAVFAF